jgi:hypothetical protein
MNREIYNYIIKDLENSNTFYWVNGTPEKRLMRIREYAWHLLTNMSDERYKHYELLIETIKKNKK